MTRRLPSYHTFGKQALASRFNVLLKEIENVKTKNDADAIHDVRVASRRFHAAALLFKDCMNAAVLAECERRVRRIRKSAGEVRDGDVQRIFVEQLLMRTTSKRYQLGLERLILRLSQRREKKQQDIFSALDAFEKCGITQKMKRFLISAPAARSFNRQLSRLTLRQRAAREIIVHLSSLLTFEQFVHQPTASVELHEMRIAAKRLRYVMEIFAPIYKGKLKPFIRITKDIQDALGEMHDCDVWLATLPLFLERERKRTAKFLGDTATFHRIEKGIMYLSDYARRQRTTHYRSFVRIWNKAEREEIWKKLSETVIQF